MARATYVIINGELITKSIEGVITHEYARLTGGRAKESAFAHYGSDTLPGGVNGIVNHADGKRYDSKSQYERAVKAKGCRIVGNDMNASSWKAPIERGIRGDFNVRPQLKQAVERVIGC